MQAEQIKGCQFFVAQGGVIQTVVLGSKWAFKSSQEDHSSDWLIENSIESFLPADETSVLCTFSLIIND